MSPISKSAFKQFLNVLPVDKVVQKLVNTERGQRLWPSKTSKNDKKYNFRADKGSTLPDGSHEIIFQANKNAENKGVRQSAQEDSHRIVAKAAVNPDEGADNLAKDALTSFDENN